ncbi:hypothetical protein [Chromohalobacter sp. HP20-39]|uniref:hypothetical protein n=1 Tax=Chromohalobacter sp. HP20-39 TaxID=3079306 RepID=UPI00294AE66E|nr:hypothetical protein [Chromohalobacter sp. HP20-39]MDV6319409.1 hypothetical protein [Chromohalobacter sp. HP20-39]
MVEELGGFEKNLPIPNSTPEAHEATEHSYYYLNMLTDKPVPQGRWSQEPSLDKRDEYSVKEQPEPLGQEPTLPNAREGSGTQKRANVVYAPVPGCRAPLTKLLIILDFCRLITN